MSKRVVFTFDNQSLEELQSLQKREKAPSIATVVRDALRLKGAISSQNDEGYDEVVVRNSKTGKEKVLIRK